jgi:CDP-diacylglycerol--glycerol-3-phosphate 3-phosphatidyltransferase
MGMSGLYVVKPWFVARLSAIEDLFVDREVSPNAVTFGAVVVSAVAGAAIAGGTVLDQPLLWLAVLPLSVIRLALNALDGSVARRLNASTPFGAAINELGDRVGDLVQFAPLLMVGPAWLVVAGIAAMTLTSTAGVMSLTLTGRRDTSGPMGKADRVLVLALAALVAGLTGSQLPFVIGLIVVAAGCIFTTVLRLRRLSRVASHVH